MTQLSANTLEDLLNRAECLITESRIAAAYDKLAATLNLHYAKQNPIILVAMSGGLIPAGHLLTRLSFLHRMDYLHATRYVDNQATQSLKWLAKPTTALTGEHVLIIDDIFDEGVTLKAIVEDLAQHEPASILTCVLLNKLHDNKVTDFTPDFVGTDVEDRYIFGCGMDYHGYLRHLPGIYALREDM